ncbi:MAG TPA: cytochrome c oxidase assembly protein [Acidimicrobiia bacterium]|nr:cytochrome c oxidase assembly protein [Acidimicrobiia bacterium]
MLADVPFPAWTPHPEVWLLVALFALGYALAVTRLGPRLAPNGTAVVTRFQAVSFSAGLAALWVASDWPIHDVAEKYLFSVHMAQHVTYSMVAAPLMLIGTPTWLARWLLSPRWLLSTVRYLSRLIPATIVFNVVVIVTHTPVVVNAALEHALLHFAIHAVIFVSSLLVWMPVLSPLPEVPRLQPLARLLFLFLQSVVPTIPASFLTFGSTPLYTFYNHVPRLFAMSELTDMQVAGVVMKIGVGFALWVVITILFFKWYSAEEVPAPSRRVSRDLERELMGLRQP